MDVIAPFTHFKEQPSGRTNVICVCNSTVYVVYFDYPFWIPPLICCGCEPTSVYHRRFSFLVLRATLRLRLFPHLKWGIKRHSHSSKYAHDEYRRILVDCRAGINQTPESIQAMNDLLVPLIKDKHQSIGHVYATHAEDLGCSGCF